MRVVTTSVKLTTLPARPAVAPKLLSNCSFLPLLEPPVFSRKPSPVDIVKGSEVILECEISGTPPFDVAWFKDRRQIRSSKKYKVTAKNYHTGVRILNVEAADVGEYQCKAQNDVGSDTCVCTVKLKETSSAGKYTCQIRNDAGSRECMATLTILGW
uniref:Uncharacterized protein n=1 Tax=Corvus moneduloides TaxID=1196302 RepID=A0A8U7MHF1_CORMO